MFTMSPNADELTRLGELRAEKREARLARQAEKDAAEREKRERALKDKLAECPCGELMSIVRTFAKAKLCVHCERQEAVRLQREAEAALTER